MHRDCANKVIDGIAKLHQQGERTGASIRWIWELNQNAVDSGATSITIEITEKHIDFKHNGHEFTVYDLFQIVRQSSLKERIQTSEFKEGLNPK